MLGPRHCYTLAIDVQSLSLAKMPLEVGRLMRPGGLALDDLELKFPHDIQNDGVMGMLDLLPASVGKTNGDWWQLPANLRLNGTLRNDWVAHPSDIVNKMHYQGETKKSFKMPSTAEQTSILPYPLQPSDE